MINKEVLWQMSYNDLSKENKELIDKTKDLEKALWLACELIEKNFYCDDCPIFCYGCQGEVEDRIKCPETLKQYFINKAKEEKC